VFFEEIGEATLSIQVKLLRVSQERRTRQWAARSPPASADAS
jgi:transcriptional regulator with GAF, ATPase, and Fis domain